MKDKHPIASQETEQPSVPVHTGNICSFPLTSSPDGPLDTFPQLMWLVCNIAIQVKVKVTSESGAATTTLKQRFEMGK